MQKAVDRSVHSRAEAAGDGLGRCLMDGDATQVSSEHRRRRQAFGLSILMETAALALLVIAPLLTSVAKPIFTQPVFTPIALGRVHTTTVIRNHNNLDHHTEIFRNSSLLFNPPGYVPARPPQDEPEDAGPVYDAGPALNGAGFDPPAFLDSRSVEPPPAVDSRKSEATRPLKVSGGIEEAQLISRVEPRYPQLAVITKREGTVILHAIISRDGRINFLEVVSGPPLLVQAACDAVRQWRYRPTLLNGESVEVETTITVNFRLRVE